MEIKWDREFCGRQERRAFLKSSVSEMYLGHDPILLPYFSYICVQTIYLYPFPIAQEYKTTSHSAA